VADLRAMGGGEKDDYEREKREKFHGLVDPLCGTSWDKWNWDKLHCGYRACPRPGGKERSPAWVYDLSHGTRRGLF